MHTTPERKPDEERENRETGEDAHDRATREADAAPASAEQFRITNLQHWIDLSALTVQFFINARRPVEASTAGCFHGAPRSIRQSCRPLSHFLRIGGLAATKTRMPHAAVGRITSPNPTVLTNRDGLPYLKDGALRRTHGANRRWPRIWAWAFFIAEWAIRLVMLFYVPQKRSPAAARTWLLLIFIEPFLGLFLYALLGRAYMPKRRLEL